MADNPHLDKTDPNWIVHSRKALFEAVRDDKESVVRELISAGIDVNRTYKKSSILLLAVRSGNERMVNLLIDAGADVNISYAGKAALFCAVENGNESMVDLLISRGADVNIKVYSGGFIETALSYAVDICSESIVNKLIEAGADVNAIYGYHDNALIMAVRGHNYSIASRLIDAGGDVNIIDGNGTTPLWIAAMGGTNAFMVSKLINAGADVNTPTFLDTSAFLCALEHFFSPGSEEEHLKTIQMFVEEGNADLNRRYISGRTPLFYSRSVSVTSYLIKKGANLFHKDNCNGSILSYYLEDIMSKYAHSKDPSLSCDMVQNLLQHGVQRDDIFEAIINLLFTKALSLYSLDDQDGQGFYKMLELAKEFLPKNWIFYRTNRRRKNLIEQMISMITSEVQNATSYYESIAPRILASLIDLGANPNSVDSEGNTALHYATTLRGGFNYKLFQEIVLNICHQLIFGFGASLHIKDYEEQTPLLFSFSSLCRVPLSSPGQGREYTILVKVCKFLLDHGASVEDATQEGFTVFHYILKLFDESFHFPDDMERRLQELIKLCELFFNPKVPGNKEFTVNKRSANGLSSPLHEWASLRLKRLKRSSTANYTKTLVEDYTFEKLLKVILMGLLKFGAKLNDKNKDEETPLHLCTTWAAMNLLLEAGANPKVVDSAGRPPLLSAAKKIRNSKRFYPDVMQEPKAFWRTALEKGLDPWAVDNHGASVFSVLIGSQKYVLSKALLEVARDDKYIKLDTIASPILNAICNDKSTRTHWKSNLVEMILTSTRNPLSESLSGSPLQLCCKNIVERFKRSLEDDDDDDLDDDDDHHHHTKMVEKFKYLHDRYIDDDDDDGGGGVGAGDDDDDKDGGGGGGGGDDDGGGGDDDDDYDEEDDDGGDDDGDEDDGSGGCDEDDDGGCDGGGDDDDDDENDDDDDGGGGDEDGGGGYDDGEDDDHHHHHSKMVIKFRYFRVPYIDDDDDDDDIFEIGHDDDEVHWTIAKLLLAHGADVNVPDANGQSCLDIAEDCPPLKELLLRPHNVDEIPLLIPWTSVSREHEDKLAQVARRRESKHVESFWYHQDLLQSGSFGAVFAGINEKDGREVAIKRIEKRHMQRPEDKREMTNLTVLADCQQVVRYLCFFEDEYFSYVVLELMEGNLEECLDKALRIETRENFCQDVVDGLKFLHTLNILHRDLKPTNILYRTHPKLCLKIADFGLSRRIDSSSTTVYGTNAGTRCWIAPEVLKSSKDHSKSSDVFACGLVLHYILSEKRHPFTSADCATKNVWQTESNVVSDKMEGWDDSLSPEATHLVRKMLESDKTRRPTAEEAPSHPLFWTKRKKIDLLVAVGNQNPEFACPRCKRWPPVSAVEMDLETGFGPILRVPKWDDPRNVNMPVLYSELTKKRSRYDTISVVELVRFIRNAYAHVTELSQPNLLLKDFVFLEYFPNLVMEVYKAVTTHGWDQARKEIKYIIDN